MAALGLISVGVRGFLGLTGLTCLLLIVHLCGRDAPWRKSLLGGAYTLCWLLFLLTPEAAPAVYALHLGILLYIGGYFLLTAGDASTL